MVILVIGLLQTKLTRKQGTAAKEFNSQGKQWMNTAFRMADVLEPMGMTRNAARGFCRIQDEELVLQNQMNRKNHFFTAVSTGFGVFMQVLIFGVGALLVLSAEANPGVIIAASIIMGRALAPVNQGISALRQTVSIKNAIENLGRLLRAADKTVLKEPDQVKGDLHLENVSLVIQETQVLEGIDFHLQAGEIMGLVGPNGAGKTSLCRLILGMWSPTEGTVFLDDEDISLIDDDGLGRFMGYLPQNVELFSGSISENIARMGDVDDKMVVDAALHAGAHEVILSLPAGYDTEIGESGRNLSGGQRQRVGLARALYGGPKLVILDEPDANLDESGEKALMAALAHLKQMKATTIMITHKPALLQTVDKILMLQEGCMTGFDDRGKIFRQMMEA